MQFVDTNVCLGARRFQRPSHDCTAEHVSLHGLLAARANLWLCRAYCGCLGLLITC
jgi:hypothetical protein